jgi:hypothetical protein
MYLFCLRDMKVLFYFIYEGDALCFKSLFVLLSSTAVETTLLNVSTKCNDLRFQSESLAEDTNAAMRVYVH